MNIIIIQRMAIGKGLLISLLLIGSVFGTLELFEKDDWKSGYFNSGRAGDELFFVLVKARNKAANVPLIIWLNGGPGCASSYGLFEENGPVFINRTEHKFRYNPYSWSVFADVIYVDQPAGVGLSLAKDNDSYCTNQICIAKGFYHFFLNFLEAYPEYKKRDLYFSGESYAGHYIPAIASYFVSAHNDDIILKGAAIGNPLTRLSLQILAYPQFLLENKLLNYFTYFLSKTISLICYIADELHAPPALLLDICDVGFAGMADLPNPYDIREKKSYDDMDEMIVNLLLDKETQKILKVNVSSYEMCSKKIGQTMALDVPTSLSYGIEALLQANINVMLYFGDKDYICNWRGGEVLADSLKWNGAQEFTKATKRDWKFGDSVGGIYKKHKNFIYLTVKDAGHMVPLDQPVSSLEMIRKFIAQSFE